MTFSITLEPIPLAVHADGVVQVGGTRVTLDTVVAAFNRGATAEEICLAYPSLQLADVYGAIAFYLRRQSDVEATLQQRQQLARDTRNQNEAKFTPVGVRERLLSRQKQQETR